MLFVCQIVQTFGEQRTVNNTPTVDSVLIKQLVKIVRERVVAVKVRFTSDLFICDF